jgi:hypothetical protein
LLSFVPDVVVGVVVVVVQNQISLKKAILVMISCLTAVGTGRPTIKDAGILEPSP